MEAEVRMRYCWVQMCLHTGNASLAPVHKVLQRPELPRLKRRRWRRKVKRYQKGRLGERVQMDSIKIAPGLYRYTVSDDYTRVMVLGLYLRRTAANAGPLSSWTMCSARYLSDSANPD